MTYRIQGLSTFAAAMVATTLSFGAMAQAAGAGAGTGATGASPGGTAESRGNTDGSNGAPAPMARKGMSNGSTSAAADSRFVQQAALDGMAEVELAKLAQQQAASDKVKDFARRMEQDHTQANDQLKQIATGKGMTPPATLDGAHRRMVDRLGKMQGASFDQAYMDAMVQDHRKAVSLFQRESRSGQDAELKSFASATLPKLQDHLRMAREGQRAVRPATGPDSTAGGPRSEPRGQ